MNKIIKIWSLAQHSNLHWFRNKTVV